MSYENKREYKGERVSSFVDDYVVIDIETTGLSPAYDEIIEIGAIRYIDNVAVDQFGTLINPVNPVSNFISNLTGITNEMLQDAPPIEDVLPSFLKFVGNDIVVGHNVNFDINFIYDNCAKHLSVVFDNDFFDTLRIAKRRLLPVSSFKLGSLAKHFNVPIKDSHRAIGDCETTHMVYQSLKQICTENSDITAHLSGLDLSTAIDMFSGKLTVIKGKLNSLAEESAFSLVRAAGGRPTDVFYQSAKCLVLSKMSYKNFENPSYQSTHICKARELSAKGFLRVISEEEFCKIFGITKKSHSRFYKYLNEHSHLKVSSIEPTITEFDTTHPLYGKVCVFTGVLERMPRKNAAQCVVNLGGQCGDGVTKKTNYLILGNNDYCVTIKGGKSSKQKKAEQLLLDGQDIQIMPEDVFYDMLEQDF